MKKGLLAVLVLLVCLAVTNVGVAQNKPQGITPQPNQTDSALTAQIRTAFQSISTSLLKAVREMPEDKYNFRPADGVRTFGELVSHIANVQQQLCENINGHGPKNVIAPTSKENRIKALEVSNGECQIAFSELSAENANKMVKAPSGEVTHLTALVFIITHASEEYGQMSMYLRQNNLVPPTTDDVKGGGAERSRS